MIIVNNSNYYNINNTLHNNGKFISYLVYYLRILL